MVRSPAMFVVCLALLSACTVKDSASVDDTGAAAGPLVFTSTSEGWAPLDACPTADGDEIWFIGSQEGEPTLARVDSTGATTAVLTGDPLVSPYNLSVAVDDSAVFVADPGAMGGGSVHVVSPDGEVTGELALGLLPRGVHAEDDGSLLVTGLTDMQPAVFRLSADGDETGVMVATTLASGGALVKPVGVVSTPDGGVFVTDEGAGALFSIADGVATALLTGLDLAEPAGLSATTDGSVLVISAHAEDGNDEVILYDRASGTATATSAGIEGNVEGGGVHRAAGDNVWAWADLSAGGAGTVYRVNLY